ncbi:SPI-2 type III secretion system apparatus protein SsaK [Salmonella enterica]|nr:SPI-2 type III secretion system apparatus protein SsaK [Salmonella enterica]EEP5156870.1 SPI-2 type III secretion system apparatus protein SsaK [Salmonella enterica]EGX6200041.1 type III secretion system protein SsaK [Salmonella enterica]EIM2305080.1 SPI-2 type III secretion system apparatus protein SsaK [Salmonella enterica]
MSFTSLPLTEINHKLPARNIIESQWITLQLTLFAQEQQANSVSHAIVNAAYRKAEKIIRDAYRSQRQQKMEQQQEIERLRKHTLEELEAEWLERHVKYLLEDESQFRALIDQAAHHIKNSIEQVLMSWFEQQSVDSVMCHRLARQAMTIAEEGVLYLHIHPEKEALMRETFGKRFTLIIEPGFSTDQAELSSTRYSVEFSLSRHFNALLKWLRNGEDYRGGDGY